MTTPRSNQVWRLQTMSFVGVLAWASHYMGYLKPPDKRDNPNLFSKENGFGPDPISVESILEPERAKALSTDDFTYKPGVQCERYLSKADMVAAAIAQFLDLAEPGEVLMSEYDYLTSGDKPLATKEA